MTQGGQVASGYTILCVEGRKPAAERWAHVLNDDGHRVVSAGTRKTALAKLQQARPTLILVDSPSLRCNGHRLCDALKEESFGVPLLALSASGDKSGPPKGADSHLRYPVRFHHSTQSPEHPLGHGQVRNLRPQMD